MRILIFNQTTYRLHTGYFSPLGALFMSFQINTTPPVEAKRRLPGLGTVIAVGAGAIIAAVVTAWLGIGAGWPNICAVALAIAIATVCVVGAGFYFDNISKAEHEKYMTKLREMDRRTF
jgi:hypothetical protein